MQSSTDPAKAIARNRRKFALNWIDLLVITATSLSFAAVVAANDPHATRAQTRNGLLSTDLPAQTSQIPEDPGLIKARIGFAKIVNS